MNFDNTFSEFESMGYQVISIDQGCGIDGPIINTINATGWIENVVTDRAAILSKLSKAGYDCLNIKINIERQIDESFTIGNRTPHISLGPTRVNLTVDVVSLTPMLKMDDAILPEENDNFNLDGAL